MTAKAVTKGKDERRPARGRTEEKPAVPEVPDGRTHFVESTVHPLVYECMLFQFAQFARAYDKTSYDKTSRLFQAFFSCTSWLTLSGDRNIGGSRHRGCLVREATELAAILHSDSRVRISRQYSNTAVKGNANAIIGNGNKSAFDDAAPVVKGHLNNHGFGLRLNKHELDKCPCKNSQNCQGAHDLEE